MTRPISKNIIYFVFVLFFGCSNSSASHDFSKLRDSILKKLDNIETYEMTVSYSESVRGAKALILNMNSNCTTFLKYKKPNLLFVKAVGETERGSGKDKIIQKLTIYTTFDGKYQKARSSFVAGAQTTSSSVMMDTSINTLEHPFDGWNLKGFGLIEGREYIGTIKSMIMSYDFVSTGQKQNIAEFKGTINVDKLVNSLSKSMDLEKAKAFAQINASMVKEIHLQVDTKRNLVVAYTQIDSMAKRACRFQEIKINSVLKDSLFTFQSLPEEQFSDITKTVKLSRERSQKLLNDPDKANSSDAKNRAAD